MHGLTALVTGASSGIGRATALACAAEGAGVVIVARRQDALEALAAEIAALGGKALVCAADITVDGVPAGVVARAAEHFGAVDILVNNAGSNLWERSIVRTPVEDYRRLLELDLVSSYAFTHAVLPGMLARKTGTIVNVGSHGVYHPGPIVGPAYITAKAGMEGLTRFVNVEGNADGVRACYLAPGSTVTDLLDFRDNPTTAEQRALMITADDVAAAVVFVAALPPRATVDTLIIRPTAYR